MESNMSDDRLRQALYHKDYRAPYSLLVTISPSKLTSNVINVGDVVFHLGTEGSFERVYHPGSGASGLIEMELIGKI
jgi:hypothetical protein